MPSLTRTTCTTPSAAAALAAEGAVLSFSRRPRARCRSLRPLLLPSPPPSLADGDAGDERVSCAASLMCARHGRGGRCFTSSSRPMLHHGGCSRCGRTVRKARSPHGSPRQRLGIVLRRSTPRLRAVKPHALAVICMSQRAMAVKGRSAATVSVAHATAHRGTHHTHTRVAMDTTRGPSIRPRCRPHSMLKANTVWNAAAMSTLPTQSTKTRQNRPSKHLRRRPKRSSVVAPVLVISAPMATVIAAVSSS